MIANVERLCEPIGSLLYLLKLERGFWTHFIFIIIIIIHSVSFTSLRSNLNYDIIEDTFSWQPSWIIERQTGGKRWG